MLIWNKKKIQKFYLINLFTFFLDKAGKLEEKKVDSLSF